MNEIIKIKNKNNYKISFFYKNKKNKNIGCLLKPGILEKYTPKKKNNNEYELLSQLKTIGYINKNIIPKYSFCELNEGKFLFCGFLDKTIKLYYNKNEFSFILDEYATSIININEKEFITGHSDGKLMKWEIDKINNNNQIINRLNIIISIKSNNNCITALEYNEKLNILLSGDNKSIIIRNYYNFEFLSYIKLNQNNYVLNKIISIKISTNNLIYALININENNLSELHCYSLNGTFSCKTEGHFTDFELTDNGNIIIGDLKNGMIKILRGYDLFKIYSKPLSYYKINKNNFNIIFESPNILYENTQEKDFSIIKRIIINPNDEKYFI
jgi:hypothetical protein